MAGQAHVAMQVALCCVNRKIGGSAAVRRAFRLSCLFHCLRLTCRHFAQVRLRVFASSAFLSNKSFSWKSSLHCPILPMSPYIYRVTQLLRSQVVCCRTDIEQRACIGVEIVAVRQLTCRFALDLIDDCLYDGWSALEIRTKALFIITTFGDTQKQTKRIKKKNAAPWKVPPEWAKCLSKYSGRGDVT